MKRVWKFSKSTAHGSKRILPILFLIFATIAVYALTAKFSLLNTLDDKYYLIVNDTIQSFSTANIKKAFSEYYVGNYAPIHIVSFMLDYLLWGLNPAGYHLENVLIHLGNGLLFYLFLRRLSMSEWQAASAAWIFLLHPVQVETVAWVSQRKNLLAMFFFLLAMLGYQAYLERRSNKAGQYVLSIVAIVAAMLSKSVAVIFPAVALLYDFTYVTDSERTIFQRMKDKLPYVLIAAVVAFMAILSQSTEMGGGRRDYPGGSPAATFFTMVPVLWSYIRDCFWPFELSPFYMVTIRQHPDQTFALSAITLTLVFAAGVFLYFRFRSMLFWFGLFFIALVPVLQFIPLITLKNDRYLYFPLLGFSVLIVFFVVELMQLLSPLWKKALLVWAFLIMAAMPLLAFKQTVYWRNDVTIWTRAVDLDPENRLAWLQLAKGYTDQSDAKNAIYALTRYKQLRLKYGPVRGYEDQ